MTQQTILITGAGTGFGRLAALELARRGHTVFAGVRDTTGRNAGVSTELRDLAAGGGLALHVLDLDVSDDASVERAVQNVLQQTGRLDSVINNAGLFAFGPAEAFSSAQAGQLFDTNVLGPLRVIRAALPAMRTQRGGLLIQLSSVLGRVALPFTGLYSASKFALEGLTDALRHELAEFGIEAVTFQPGAYPTTSLTSKALPLGGPAVAAYAAGMGRVGAATGSASEAAGEADPHEVANRIAWLVELPSGQHPPYVVVAPGRQGEGTETINAASELATAQFLKAMHLGPESSVAGQDPYAPALSTG